MFETIVMPLIGGIFIGLAAATLLLFKGRIAGICGIVFSLLESKEPNKHWRLAFILSLIFGTFIAHFIFSTPIPGAPSESTQQIVIAGLIAGAGSYLANGCTSGHGVCGIGRGSIRSLVATMTFMFTGIVTVTLLRVFGA